MIHWNEEKNVYLKATRNVSFVEIVNMIEKGDILGEAPHPNTAKYPHQRVFYVRINGYVHYVPYVVEADGSLFLKTIIPSRAAMKAYGGKP